MTIVRGAIASITGGGFISATIDAQDWKTSEKLHIGDCDLYLDSCEKAFHGEIVTIYGDYTLYISINYWIDTKDKMHRGSCTIFQDEVKP